MSHAPRQLLVVEDDVAVASVLGEYFATDGRYLVTVAEGGAAAMDALARPPGFDLVVLNLTTPKVPGLAVAAHAIHHGTPVLLTSGDLEVADAAAELGVNLIAKPYHLRDLQCEVERTVAISRGDLPAATAELSRLRTSIWRLREELGRRR